MVTASHNPAARQRLQGLRRHRFADRPAGRRRDRAAHRGGGAGRPRSRTHPTPTGSNRSVTTRSTRTSTSRRGRRAREAARAICGSCTRRCTVSASTCSARCGSGPASRRRSSSTQQAKPDPDFPTAPFPNPEEPGVLDLALELADRHHADLVLANDPDADRLAVAVPHGGAAGRCSPVTRSVRCSARTCSRRRAATTASWPGRSCRRRLLDGSRTRPVCPPARRSPGSSGSRVRVTPTAGGSCSGTRRRSATRSTPAVRDKDGLTAALAIADLAARRFAHRRARPARRGARSPRDRPVVDALRGRGRRRRVHRAVARRAARRCSAASPVDRRASTTATASTVCRPADLLEFELADGSRVLVRPSGTEPKVKCYFEVVVEPHHGPEAQKRLAALQTAFQQVAGTMPG